MSKLFWVGPPEQPDQVRLGPAVASGAEGVLYRGTVNRQSEPLDIAVKMLQPGHLGRLSEWTDRWRDQVELLRSVEIQGLVRVLGGFVGPLPHTQGNADPSTASLYLLMEWVEGAALDYWRRSKDELEPEDLLLPLLQVGTALDLLHSGMASGGSPVLHRDIKPANILVRSDGGAVLVDVGSVRGLDDARRSGVVGTPGYIAPEVHSDGLYTPAADRYSVGAVAYFLLTGEEPPVGATPTELQARLAQADLVRGRQELVAHVSDMLSADPDRRPSPLGNWLAQVRSSSLLGSPLTGHLPPAAPGRNPRQLAPTEVTRRVNRLHALAVLLVALVVALVGSLTVEGKRRNADPSSRQAVQAEPSVLGLTDDGPGKSTVVGETSPSTSGDGVPPTSSLVSPAGASTTTVTASVLNVITGSTLAPQEQKVPTPTTPSTSVGTTTPITVRSPTAGSAHVTPLSAPMGSWFQFVGDGCVFAGVDLATIRTVQTGPDGKTITSSSNAQLDGTWNFSTRIQPGSPNAIAGTFRFAITCAADRSGSGPSFRYDDLFVEMT